MAWPATSTLKAPSPSPDLLLVRPALLAAVPAGSGEESCALRAPFATSSTDRPPPWPGAGVPADLLACRPAASSWWGARVRSGVWRSPSRRARRRQAAGIEGDRPIVAFAGRFVRYVRPPREFGVTTAPRAASSDTKAPKGPIIRTNRTKRALPQPTEPNEQDESPTQPSARRANPTAAPRPDPEHPIAQRRSRASSAQPRSRAPHRPAKKPGEQRQPRIRSTPAMAMQRGKARRAGQQHRAPNW